ncbi:hypothetical protein [Fredinandcohnia sp. FSL W7-1320]|uniref:hypothetical protein n=2 Tax=unclassified Fredinandcohnia TaxID=2837514 RepID=UPI0030FDD12B
MMNRKQKEEYVVLMVKKTKDFSNLLESLRLKNILVDYAADIPIGLGSPLEAMKNMWCLKKMGKGLPIPLGDMDAQGLYLGQALGQEHKKHFGCLNRFQLANHMYLAHYFNFTFFYYFGDKNNPKWQFKLEPGFSSLPFVSPADTTSVILNNELWTKYCNDENVKTKGRSKFKEMLDLADELIAKIGQQDCS